MKAKKSATCHADRPHYAKGLCKSCYEQLVRRIKTKRKADRAYEAAHKAERNEQRRLYMQRKRAEAKKLID